KALAGRVVTGRQPVTLESAPVVRRVAIFKPVWQQEIDDFVFRPPLAIIFCRRGGGRGARHAQRHERCKKAHAGTPAAQCCAMKSSCVGRRDAVPATIVSISPKKPDSSSRLS